MSIDDESAVTRAVRRNLSFLQRAEPVREFSNGKLALLTAIFIAAIFGAITLLVLR